MQIFDNTPAAKDGTLAAGDEIVGVNGQSVKGRTKVEVARMIQSVKVDNLLCSLLRYRFTVFSYEVSAVNNFVLLFQGEVTINYNKLHADPKQGKTLDISKLHWFAYLTALHCQSKKKSQHIGTILCLTLYRIVLQF